MALMELNRNPEPKTLRNFGSISLVMLTLLGGIWRWSGVMSGRGVVMLAGAGLIIFVLSLISVRLVKPIYLGLMLLSWPIGWVVGHIMMAVFYYLIMTPIGLAMRLFGRDPMQRGFDRQRKSYWIEHRPVNSASRYYRQF